VIFKFILHRKIKRRPLLLAPSVLLLTGGCPLVFAMLLALSSDA
ncbi:hypothetical protein L195_g061980, partial [Trifolium pratense]